MDRGWELDLNHYVEAEAGAREQTCRTFGGGRGRVIDCFIVSANLIRPHMLMCAQTAGSRRTHQCACRLSAGSEKTQEIACCKVEDVVSTATDPRVCMTLTNSWVANSELGALENADCKERSRFLRLW